MSDTGSADRHHVDAARKPIRTKRSSASYRSEVTLPPELRDALRFQIRRATGVADMLFAETFGDMDINAAQYAILMVVRHNPDCQTSAAGSLVGITPDNFVPLLDSLTTGGYICRTLSTKDRRVRHLRLTPKGEETCATLMARHDAMQEQIEARLGHGKVEELIRLLTLYCGI